MSIINKSRLIINQSIVNHIQNTRLHDIFEETFNYLIFEDDDLHDLVHINAPCIRDEGYTTYFQQYNK